MDLIGDTAGLDSSANGDALDAAPTVTTPIISGIAALGQTLTASATATPADDTLTFEWFSSANNFTDPIATGAAFTVTTIGVSLEVEVIATNADGVPATAISGEIFTVSGPNGDPNIPHVANSNVDEWILSDGQWAASAEPGSHSVRLQGRRHRRFHRQRHSDILWQNPNTGDTQEWLINNGGWNGTVDLGTHPGNYQIAGVGDFFGNGIDDVLWTSTSGNGKVQTDIWELSSNGQWEASVSPGRIQPATPSPASAIGPATAPTASFGTNATTGDTDEWQHRQRPMGEQRRSRHHPGSGWTIAGVGDFFGNGRDDVLWTNSIRRQRTDRHLAIGHRTASGSTASARGSHPAGYQVVAVGDFTGNGTERHPLVQRHDRRHRRMADQQRPVGRQHRSRRASGQFSDRRCRQFHTATAPATSSGTQPAETEGRTS